MALYFLTSVELCCNENAISKPSSSLLLLLIEVVIVLLLLLLLLLLQLTLLTEIIFLRKRLFSTRCQDRSSS